MPLELIIGANGYLGQYLAQACGQRGGDCLLHSRTPASARCAGTGLPFVQEDLVESRQALAQVNPQTVYLLARPVTQEAAILLDFAQNVQWLLQEWADRGCLRRVVFASTQLVYATPTNDTPLAVGAPLGPETPYDCHKAEMEFYLALLAHHRTPLKVEVFRLPLLAGRIPTPQQEPQQYLFQWRSEYLVGDYWDFPVGDGPHRTWGNSWAHVDDVVARMVAPPGDGPRFAVVQPVSGHVSYAALDAFFRRRYQLPPKRAALHLAKTAFYLRDNAGLPQRPIEDAFPETEAAA